VEKTTTIAVDLAKSVFEVAVSEAPGRVSERKRLSRSGLAAFFANRPPAVVLMEACGSAHHWGRELLKLGHDVRLLPRRVPRSTGSGTRPTAPTRTRCWRRTATRRSSRSP
jgi:transposase